ncbi:methyltransferase [Asanoa sp. WMMD1127]|uniref:methyltransferase n=1 Tax=Asanoa sp. WMMD1127 TaxID=3016107 RepID=UPI002415A490|nr:methyltransferase [Asanoa sp. WMMD1127]MDG4820773.1 methyltransferase [Asanoa sp. WMMD1127]
MGALVAETDNPASILRIGTAFCEAKALLTALELRLFDRLHEDGPLPAAGIAQRLDLHERGVPHFLDLLVTLGLLTRSEQGYANSVATDRYLVRSEPTYVGGFLERANHNLYPAWGKLGEALRTGKPQAGADYAMMIKNPRLLARFLDMMDALTNQIGPQVAEAVDWSDYRSVLDVGGARGNLLSHVVKANPHLHGIVFDLPEDAGPFAEHMAGLGLTDRMTFHPGSFLTDLLPSADAVVIGHVLHDWAPEERRMLVGKAFDALPPGGLLVIYDPMVDAELTHPENLVVSLDMLLTTDGGSEYSVEEATEWLRDAGFEGVTSRALGESDTLVHARKPGTLSGPGA